MRLQSSYSQNFPAKKLKKVNWNFLTKKISRNSSVPKKSKKQLVLIFLDLQTLFFSKNRMKLFNVFSKNRMKFFNERLNQNCVYWEPQRSSMSKSMISDQFSMSSKSLFSKIPACSVPKMSPTAIFSLLESVWQKKTITFIACIRTNKDLICQKS